MLDIDNLYHVRKELLVVLAVLFVLSVFKIISINHFFWLWLIPMNIKDY